MSAGWTSLTALLGVAIGGFALLGYGMPEFEILLASALPFCN